MIKVIHIFIPRKRYKHQKFFLYGTSTFFKTNRSVRKVSVVFKTETIVPYEYVQTSAGLLITVIVIVVRVPTL